MKNKILSVIGFVGFLIVFGSFDAREQGMIFDLQFIMIASAGLIMMFLASHFARTMSYHTCTQKEIQYRTKKSKQRVNMSENGNAVDKAC